MAETTADVRRDIEMTRERMSSTLQQLEQKLNVMQIVRENPWPALALAVGAGVLLSGSRSDVKAAAATVAATRGARTKVGSVLDDVVASMVGGLHDAVEARVTSLVNDFKTVISSRTSQPDARGPRGPRAQLADRAMPGDGRSTLENSAGYETGRAD